jgi:hypothetical protein
MKKVPVNKLVSLVGAVKGKKPVVIIVSVVVVIGAIFAINKGYISEDMLNVDAIVHFIDGSVSGGDAAAIVDSPAVEVVVDSVAEVVDSIPHE